MSENTNTREKKPNLQPGDLNQYIHLTTVSIWLVLGAFLVFVIGMVVWGFFGRLTVSVQAVAVSQESSIMLYIPEDQVSRIKQAPFSRIAPSTREMPLKHSRFRKYPTAWASDSEVLSTTFPTKPSQTTTSV